MLTDNRYIIYPLHVHDCVTGILLNISRISKVCKLWYKVAASAVFWEDVDLSGDNIVKSKRGFTWLCKNRLKFARSLNLTNWEGLVGKDIQVILAVF